MFRELRHGEVLTLLNDDEGPEEGAREGTQEFKDHCAKDIDYH